MRKKFSASIIIHGIVIIIWSLMIDRGTFVNSQAYINTVSCCLLMIFINSIYLFAISKSSMDTLIKQSYSIMPIIVLVSAIHIGKANQIFWVLSIYSFIMALMLLKKDNSVSWVDVLFSVVATVFYYFNIRVLAGVLLTVSIFSNTKQNYGYSHLNRISILPVSVKMTQRIVLTFLPLVLLLIYILDLDSIYTNLFFQIIIWFCELLIVTSLNEYGNDFQATYSGIKELSLLSDYVTKEREAFSEVLHDEIIQDIISSHNLLELKDPDIYQVKGILKMLMYKSRKIMNFYGTTIFQEFGSYENIGNVVESIKPIYPNKDIDFNLCITENAHNILKDSELMMTVLKITKELVNNTYKHSLAKYIDYFIDSDNDKLLIQSTNDGATKEDYQRAKESIGGILMIRMLISKYDGELFFEYGENKFKIEVLLGEKMKVLLFDDHLIFGESLKKLLEEKEEISHCHYVHNELDFKKILEIREFDILILDFNLKDSSCKNGIELMKEVLIKNDNLNVVILSSYDLPIYRKLALENGASEFINKSISVEELIKILKKIPGKDIKPNNIYIHDLLTDREIEVLRELCTGISRKEIAEKLYISERTLYNHIQNIYDKLEVNNGIEAYDKALKLGYLEPKI